MERQTVVRLWRTFEVTLRYDFKIQQIGWISF